METKFGPFFNLLFNRFISIIEIVRSNRKLKILVNISLFLVIGIFVGNYVTREWETIRKVQIEFSVLPLVSSFFLYGINYFLFLASWHIILKAYQVKSSFISNSYIYSSSQIAKILPTPAWFISGRLVMYQKEGSGKKIILTATFLEIVFHMIIGLIFLAFFKFDLSAPITWIYVLAFFPLLLLYVFPKSLNFSFLEIRDINFNRGIITVLTLIYLITWVISGFFFQFILNGIGVITEYSLLDFWQVWIISSIFSYIGSIILGGIGILREFTITFLLSSMISPPLALAVAGMSRIIMTIGNMLWPLLVIGLVSLNRKNSHAQTVTSDLENNEDLDPRR